MSTSNPIRPGHVGGTPIIADFGGWGGPFDGPVTSVMLSADYVLEYPNGYFGRPNGGNYKNWPNSTIPSGTTVELFAPEAAALVTGGFATNA